MLNPTPWTDDDVIAAARSINEGMAHMDAALAPLVRHARTLGDRGWTWPVGQLLTFVPVLLALTAPEHAADDLDAAFVAFYARRRGAEFDALAARLARSPELAPWRPLLAECVAAYRRRAYLVAVPALLTAYEGALAAVVGRAQATRQPQRLAAEELGAADRNLERVVWASVDAFTAGLFAAARFGGARPARLNRNWVLHGRDVPAWTRADCLRLFQAVETLSSARLVSKRDLRAFLKNKDLADLLGPGASRRGPGTA